MTIPWEEVNTETKRTTGVLVLDDSVLDKPYSRTMVWSIPCGLEKIILSVFKNIKLSTCCGWIAISIFPVLAGP